MKSVVYVIIEENTNIINQIVHINRSERLTTVDDSALFDPVHIVPKWDFCEFSSLERQRSWEYVEERKGRGERKASKLMGLERREVTPRGPCKFCIIRRWRWRWIRLVTKGWNRRWHSSVECCGSMRAVSIFYLGGMGNSMTFITFIMLKEGCPSHHLGPLLGMGNEKISSPALLDPSRKRF